MIGKSKKARGERSDTKGIRLEEKTRGNNLKTAIAEESGVRNI